MKFTRTRRSIAENITIVFAAIAFAAALSACGQLQTATDTPSAPTVADTPPAVGTSVATPAAASPTAASPTAIAGLTDTGYKAPDGSPLYKECIGPDPVAVAQGTPAALAPRLPLPPTYPTPSGSVVPPPTPPSNPNPNPRPVDADLPSFDVLSVAPSDTSTWPRASTPCFGGLSFSMPPAWDAVHALGVGGYQQGAGAQFATSDGKTKIDLDYMFTQSDEIADFNNGTPGNGSYRLVQPTQTAIAGAPALQEVTSEIVGSPSRYVVIAYVINPRPNWYLTVTAFFDQPYSASSIADFLATVRSLRFAP